MNKEENASSFWTDFDLDASAASDDKKLPQKAALRQPPAATGAPLDPHAADYFAQQSRVAYREPQRQPAQQSRASYLTNPLSISLPTVSIPNITSSVSSVVSSTVASATSFAKSAASSSTTLFSQKQSAPPTYPQQSSYTPLSSSGNYSVQSYKFPTEFTDKDYESTTPQVLSSLSSSKIATAYASAQPSLVSAAISSTTSAVSRMAQSVQSAAATASRKFSTATGSSSSNIRISANGDGLRGMSEFRRDSKWEDGAASGGGFVAGAGGRQSQERIKSKVDAWGGFGDEDDSEDGQKKSLLGDSTVAPVRKSVTSRFY